MSLVSELLVDPNNWKNIQTIVCSTFKAVNQVLIQQESTISQLQASFTLLQKQQDQISDLIDQTVAKKEDVRSVQDQVHELNDTREFQQSIKHLQNDLHSMEDSVSKKILLHCSKVYAAKSDLKDVRTSHADDLMKELELKADKDLINEKLNNKCNRSELKDMENNLLRSVKAIILKDSNLKSTDNRIIEDLQEINLLKDVKNSKMNEIKVYDIDLKIKEFKSEIQLEYQKSIKTVNDELQNDIKEINSALNKKAMSFDLDCISSSKIDRKEFLDAISNHVCKQDIDISIKKEVDNATSSLQNMLQTLKKELITALNKKAYKSDISRSLQQLPRTDDVKFWLSQKANLCDMKEAYVKAIQASSSSILELQNEITEEFHSLKKDMIHRFDTLDYDCQIQALRDDLSKMNSWKTDIEHLKSEMLHKVNAKDCYSLLDLKSNITDINGVFDSIQRELDHKATAENLNAVEMNLLSLRKEVRSEICMGRWIWKNGKPNKKQSINWNSEALNTGRDIFIWDKRESDTIRAIAPGLYHFEAAFFTDRSPTIQLLVNDEPALIASETIQKDLKYMRRSRHSAGIITGVQISEFIALPPRCRISLSYDTDEYAQGFLALKKL